MNPPPQVLDRSLPMPALTKSVQSLARRPASEAIASELVALLADPPFTGQKTRPLWTSLTDQLRDRHAFASSVAPLRALAVDYRSIFGPTVVGTWLETRIRALLAALEERFPDAPTAPPASVKPRIAAPRGTVEELLAMVHANPDDDAARVVLADALLERNDPRGEFVMLQCRPDADALPRAEAKRVKELLRLHAREWLGPVADVTQQTSRVFRRGFLHHCSFIPRGKFITPATGHPAWSTVRSLEVRSAYDDKGLALITHPVLHGVRYLERPSDEVVRVIAASSTPRALEHLAGSFFGLEGMMPELHDPRGLPHLAEITLTESYGFGSDPERVIPFLASPLGRRLRTFRLHVYADFIAGWVRVVIEHARCAVEIVNTVTLRIEGKRLHVGPAPRYDAPDVAVALAALPSGHFTEVEIEPALRSGAADRAASKLIGGS